MSACKAGCGRPATENEGRLCEPCNDAWWASPEWSRWDVLQAVMLGEPIAQRPLPNQPYPL